MVNDQQVLVTGATGFIALQTVCDLLEAGFRVRGTVRSLEKADNLRETLREHTPMADMLECVEADLNHDEGWESAMEGCQSVLHIASPFPAGTPRNPDVLIKTAHDGTLRVLRTARAAGVSRVVMTSSMAAIAYGRKDTSAQVLSEDDWSDSDDLKDNTAYSRSKTIAERAAWTFINSPESGGMELVALNPALVLGPALSSDVSTSLEIVSQIMGGKLPALPKLNFTVIDVRDVSRAHMLALTHQNVAGQRFFLGGEAVSLRELAEILRAGFPEYDRAIPRRELPNWMVRVLSLFNPPLRQIVCELGKTRQVSNEKMRTVLGIDPVSAREATLQSARSLKQYGVV